MSHKRINKAVLTMVIGFALSVTAAMASEEADQETRRVAHGFLGQGRWQPLGADETFLAIVQEPPVMRNGAVILLHDRFGHPNQTGIVRALRTALPGHGWVTLSLQRPDAPPAATAGGDAAEVDAETQKIWDALTAAIDFLKKQELKTIVLLGQGESAGPIGRYAVEKCEKTLCRGVVWINPLLAAEQNQALPEQLTTGGYFLFDLVGEEAFPAVLRAAVIRRAWARQPPKAGGKSSAGQYYRQKYVLQADQNFLNRTATAIRQLRVWLRNVD